MRGQLHAAEYPCRLKGLCTLRHGTQEQAAEPHRHHGSRTVLMCVFITSNCSTYYKAVLMQCLSVSYKQCQTSWFLAVVDFQTVYVSNQSGPPFPNGILGADAAAGGAGGGACLFGTHDGRFARPCAKVFAHADDGGWPRA